MNDTVLAFGPFVRWRLDNTSTGGIPLARGALCRLFWEGCCFSFYLLLNASRCCYDTTETNLSLRARLASGDDIYIQNESSGSSLRNNAEMLAGIRSTCFYRFIKVLEYIVKQGCIVFFTRFILASSVCMYVLIYQCINVTFVLLNSANISL